MKKILAVLLVLSLMLCASNSIVLAEENNTIPENATKHTVELVLEPGDNYIANVNRVEDGVSPYVWGDPSMSLADNYAAYTSSFYVTDAYFAYEMYGVLANGAQSSEYYNVALEYTSGGVISSMSGYADGSTYKNDWISLYVDDYYRFKVTNYTDYVLSVYITYYSWN